ncbi:class I SAM-dependent methyltransferase [Mangrovimonas spongiae]|uniref:Class I SAM-dependent methyltransferase n=1 Tax=Mangrovimonas spongiae TaxID=2494697 RepID=A0A3R9N6Q7_9FLAO|nr:class I SAM-dependent methyltransferase [Mangrovimonas spongiae]RSK40268.1 class I SAM-dependent methyltransferase [Mangrovimonas spongiae]
MSYAKLTRENKSKIRKYSHQKRLDMAVKLIDLKQDESLIDYGTGDGYLLKLIYTKLKNKQLYGFDPVDDMFEELKQTIATYSLQDVSITKNLNTLENKKFDVVSCQEVLEHFSATKQQEHLKNISNLLKDNGRVVISVPLEIGFPSLVKNSIRFLVGQSKAEATFKNIVKSFLGLEINRPKDDYIYTHIGFNHKHLEKVFEDVGFIIETKQYSPFKYLYNFVNSQVFYILKKQHV